MSRCNLISGPFLFVPGEVGLKKQLEMLIELQKLDLAQEELRLDVEKKREKVEADTDMLLDLEQTLTRQTESLEETRKLLENKKDELEEARKGQEHAHTKLNAVTNSRDYAALEREAENFKKVIAQVEGEIEHLRTALGNAEEQNAKHKTEYDNLQAEIEKSRVEVDEAAASIENRVADLQAKANEIAKNIQPQVLARYRFIRSKRAGVAVVSASGGPCTGCHMRLQPQAFIVLQRQNSLECCQNCQRILYYDPEEAQALHDHPSK